MRQPERLKNRNNLMSHYKHYSTNWRNIKYSLAAKSPSPIKELFDFGVAVSGHLIPVQLRSSNDPCYRWSSAALQ